MPDPAGCEPLREPPDIRIPKIRGFVIFAGKALRPSPDRPRAALAVKSGNR
jgi:hypothetical protein